MIKKLAIFTFLIKYIVVMKLYENYKIPNTFGINVNASLYCEIENVNELLEIIDTYNIGKEDGKKYHILGLGSNTLFTKDFDGIVIRNISNRIEPVNEDEEDIDEDSDTNEVFIDADAGVDWCNFVEYATKNGFYGAENLNMIPGYVGSAPVQNIGAYGAEVKDIITYVEGINLNTGKLQVLINEDCEFGYRNSIFKNELKNKFIITTVGFKLSKEKKLNINYKDIQQYIAANNINIDNLTSLDVAKIIAVIRANKLPDFDKVPNAGSFFKNPSVDEPHYLSLKKNYTEIPSYKNDNGSYKIPAAWLIEKAELKGYRDGNVGTHTTQPLVIVNYGVDSGKEILNFAESIVDKINDIFGIKLEIEVNIV